MTSAVDLDLVKQGDRWVGRFHRGSFDQQAAFYINYQSGVIQAFDQDFSQGYVRPVRLYPED